MAFGGSKGELVAAIGYGMKHLDSAKLEFMYVMCNRLRLSGNKTKVEKHNSRAHQPFCCLIILSVTELTS
ncbi:hypothetical protein HMPREF6745_1834 [Prevotella sp. oral taxon 472 str. F0295]|nr:hypothetical protein HMPREF6745_1834 [Prevotella sp. oral taxon 472 str. F0295]